MGQETRLWRIFFFHAIGVDWLSSKLLSYDNHVFNQYLLFCLCLFIYFFLFCIVCLFFVLFYLFCLVLSQTANSVCKIKLSVPFSVSMIKPQIYKGKWVKKPVMVDKIVTIGVDQLSKFPSQSCFLTHLLFVI